MPFFRVPTRINKHVTVLDNDDIASFDPDHSSIRDEFFSAHQNENRLLLKDTLMIDLSRIENNPKDINSTVESDQELSVTQNEGYSVVIDSDSEMDLRDGILSFPDRLLVQGSLIVGKLRCTRERLADSKGAKIKVDSGAYLEATLFCAEQVEVWGTLRGNIQCETLLLGPDAKVEGNIETNFLQVMGGASINGSVKAGQNASSFDPRYQDKIIIETKKHQVKEVPLTIIQEATKRVYADPVTFTQTDNQRMSATEFYKPKKDSLDALFGKGIRKSLLKGTLSAASGKYLDSFGNPLIVEADEETVNAFREVRRFSHETRTLLDAHLRQKEKDKMLRLNQSSNGKDSNKLSLDNDTPSKNQEGDTVTRDQTSNPLE